MPQFKRFWLIVKPYQKGLWASFFLTLLLAASEPLLPALMQPLLDVSIGQQGDGQIFPNWAIPLMIIALFSGRALLTMCIDYMISYAVSMAAMRLREMIFASLVKAEPQFFISNPASKINNTLTLETQTTARQMVYTSQLVLKESLSLLALFGYLFYTNWLLTLVVMLVVPLSALLMRYFSKFLNRYMIQTMTGTDQLSYIVEENIQAYKMIRIFGAQAQQIARFNESNHYLQARTMRATLASFTVSPITQILTSIALAFVVYIAIDESTQNRMSVGSFAAYLTGMLMAIPRAKSLGDAYPTVKRGMLGLNRIFESIDIPSESDQGRIQASQNELNIKFTNVTKTYTSIEKPAIDDVSFNIRPGTMIAFVGPSGAGKTSLIQMLTRFTQPTSGVISLGGIELKMWQLSSLRDHFALVSQDVILFNDTILNNICLGRPVDLPLVQQCLREVDLLTFVNGLSNGLETIIGPNGSLLSGGQRQRISLTRALYKAAPILILDEATSSLDSETERVIQESIKRLKGKVTTIIIAHRFASIHDADHIFVLEQGKIKEEGTYDELMRMNGLFNRLSKAQRID
jgi:subfamily B ATP-binding cassette protein MsbA